MIRRLLFILFLYVLLVWIVVAYLYFSTDPERIKEQGLLWTGVGVASLLLWLILERLIGWWRVRRAQRAAKPVMPVEASKPMNEDAIALLSLLSEADQRLAQAPAASGARPARVLDLPLYLIVGPEGVGKTAVLHNCGIEPSLLAGQVLGGGAAITSTRVANLWLAQQSLFLEVSGRVFNGEPKRLVEFLSVLQPGSSTGWRSWFRPPQRPIALRGVVLFFDSRRFAGTPEPSELDRAAQQIRERMLAIAQVLGAEFPVYALFTKIDALPYFPDFFARLGEGEAGQVFGVLDTGNTGAHPSDRVWAEAETKRLNRQFQSLFLRLSDRRLLGLTQEIEAGRKPAIYEFPREFKRIRTPLVQFLVDVFKPDPLKAGPRLRGFFFTGTRKVERAAPGRETQSGYRTGGAGFEATQIFTPRMQAALADPSLMTGKAGSGPLVDSWMFVTEFFHKVLNLDRPLVRRVAVQSKLEQHRRVIIGVAAGLALFFGFVWTISWFENRGLAEDTHKAIAAVRRGSADLSLVNLQALDRLRAQLEDLDKKDSWGFHWGLYTGDNLRDVAGKVYFDRLKLLSLDRINQTLASQMQQAGVGGQGDETVSTHERLKIHRTITALGCPADQPLISKVLWATASEAYPNLEDQQAMLLKKQLDYYATWLQKNKKLPVELPEDAAADDKARSYVNSASGGDQQLDSFLDRLRGNSKMLVVADQVDGYQKVLTGQAEVSAEFTRDGMKAVEDWVEETNFGSVDDCGTGKVAAAVSSLANLETRKRLKSRYYARYAKAWREFLISYNVNHYSTIEDAARRLDILAGSASPLLGIVKLVAVNTNFLAPKPGEKGVIEKGVEKLGFGGLVQRGKKAEKEIEHARELRAGDAHPMTKADFAGLFQPVLFTTPAEADLLVNDHDGEYVKGLRGLQNSLEALGRASTIAEKTTLIPLAHQALQQASSSLRALADKFENVGNEGLNKKLTELLEQPIGFAKPWIQDPEISLLGKKNGDLGQLCRDMSRTLTKYPFTPSSPSDATLSDITGAFAPADGLVWKYEQKSGDLVVRNKKEWQTNPALQGMKVTPELLSFLNRAQQFTDALFTEGRMRMEYVLRPSSGQANGIRLVLDGLELDSSKSVLQKTFYWPAPDGAKPGAEGFVVGGATFGFGSYNGPMGVFHLFQYAERLSGTRTVQWHENRGPGGAVIQPFSPPARIDFVAYPGDVDVFNPSFFKDLKCPQKAVVVAN